MKNRTRRVSAFFIATLLTLCISGCLFDSTKPRGYGEGISGWDDPKQLVGKSFVTNSGHQECAGEEREIYQGIKFLGKGQAYELREANCQSSARELTSSEIAGLQISPDGKDITLEGRSYSQLKLTFEASISSEEVFVKPGAVRLPSFVVEGAIIFFKTDIDPLTKFVYHLESRQLIPVNKQSPIKNLHSSGLAVSDTHLFAFGGARFEGKGGPISKAVGGLFDPKTNTWETLPALGMPESRSHARVVWTGEEFFVFGGRRTYVDEEGKFVTKMPKDAASFNPLTKTWRSINMEGAPNTYTPSLAWTGQELLVLHHHHEGREKIHFYNPSTDTWRKSSQTGIRNEYSQYNKEVRRNIIKVGNELLIWSNSYRAESLFFNLETERIRFISRENSPTTALDILWNGSQMIVPGSLRGRGSKAHLMIYSYVTDSWEALEHEGRVLSALYGAAVVGNKIYTLGKSVESEPRYFIDEFELRRLFKPHSAARNTDTQLNTLEVRGKLR